MTNAKCRLGGIVAGAAAVLWLSLPGLAQERRAIPEFRVFGAPSNPQAGEAVDAVLEAYKAAWGSEDLQALMELHAEDTEWTNAFARVIQGKDALAAFLENRLFPGFDEAVARGEVARMRLISKRYLGDDAAILHFATDSGRGAARDGQAGLRRVHFHLVLAAQDGGWRIVHTAIMDAR